MFARIYFSCGSLSSDDWETVAVGLLVAMLATVLLVRYVRALEGVLSYTVAHKSAVVTYAFGVVFIIAVLTFAITLQF